jgi:CRP-like cAMP-binding protein
MKHITTRTPARTPQQCSIRLESPMMDTLTRKLDHFTTLSDEEKKALVGTVARTRTLNPDEDLVREGEPPTECHLVIDGVLCRYKLPSEGKRQIVGFLIAGDLCDLCGFLMGCTDHSVGALTSATVAVIPHKSLQTVLDAHPRLARALWQETLVDAAITREWVANTGRRSAYQRLAHLLCEIGTRSQAVGKASNGSFTWPVTQTEFADAMGLSTVHVNRMLQQLRGEGLIATTGDEIRVLDWPKLREAGEFSPDYLFLNGSAGNPRLDPAV